MERICEPNLPHGRVRRAFISGIMPDYLVSELNDMGVITYKLGKSDNMHGELAYHPDLLINNYRKGSWLCEFNAKYIEVDDMIRPLIYESENILSDLYPGDCLFNNFRLHGNLFCGMAVDHLIESCAAYDDVIVCKVPQNYTKCSTIIVSERAAITIDKGLGKEMRHRGIDVLSLPDDGAIKLRGYSTGLLGGCAAKLDEDLLAFTGDLGGYKYGDDITDFCKNHHVDTFSLTDQQMYDYGGILPITELVPFEELDDQQMRFDII